jgi:hypothetical protein
MKQPNIKRTTLAYMAGFFDGEGCISLIPRTSRGNRYRVQISISNTNEWIIQWFRFNFGGSVAFEDRREENPNWKDTWRWTITSGRQALRFLQAISPYLILKKPQAELAISFQGRHSQIGKRVSSTAALLDEAERILMSQYNKRGKN